MGPRRCSAGGTTGARRRRAGAVLALVVAVATVAVEGSAVAGAANAGKGRSHGSAGPLVNWTTYHGNSLETGVAPGSYNFQHAKEAWTSPALDGQLYGEPLVDGGLVVVATENDVVYALSASSGAVVWSTTVGTPVPDSALPCGDIDPNVGITSTPVIDTGRAEVFVVADETDGVTISHHLVGLALGTGSVELDQVVDPAGTTTEAQLQRPALALDEGRVLVGFGGNAGDCSTYHGWLVSVPEAGGAALDFEVDPTPGNDEGAIWMGGAAPVVDGNGDIWLATGNGSNTSGASPDLSDSVVELSPALGVLQTFTPSTWQSDNASDADLGSSVPVVTGNGLVLQVGKSQTAYLLSASRLGGVNGQVAEKGVSSRCASDVDGGSAFTSTATSSVVYMPCLAGVMAVKVTTKHSVRVLWRTNTGARGPAIMVGNLVWSINPDGTLVGLHKGNGRQAAAFSIGAPANHFPTPSVGDGLLLAPSADQVVAFR